MGNGRPPLSEGITSYELDTGGAEMDFEVKAMALEVGSPSLN